MDQHLADNIRSALIASPFDMKERGDWLQQGICPSCGKKELYAPSDTPWWVRCNRHNNCGYEDNIKELMPELFADWGKRYPVTDNNPNATADAYLSNMRGFNTAEIKGWYRQENYYDPKLKLGSATVRFELNGGATWDGLLDNRDKLKKSRIQGKYGGYWWQPPHFEVNDGDEIWLVEGIYDAISLWLDKDIKAIATISSVNYPKHELAKHKDKDVTWVWALDSDKAGSGAIVKFVKRQIKDGFAEEKIKAAQLPGGARDWNDRYISGQLDDKLITDAFYRGELLLASSASAKARIIWRKYGRNAFSFVFKHQVYWFNFDSEKYEEALKNMDVDVNDLDDEKRDEALKRAGSVKKICSAEPQILYYQHNQVTDEAWYFSRVFFPNGHKHDLTFTNNQISGAADFKKRLLTAPNARWKGTTSELETYLELSMQGHIKIVKAIDFIGYDITSGMYVFDKFAVRSGKLIEANEENYFQAGKLAIKSTSKALSLDVDLEGDNYTHTWVQQVWRAFGEKGLIVLAYWYGSLFAEQIRRLQKSYPFLELCGEPGAGKSSLLEFLWKLVGRSHYEGFNPSKATYSGLSRNFLQTSNLPTVLSEGDTGKDSKKGMFNYDLLKDCYEGRGFISRGLKNGGNETYEPPFKGSIIMSQNFPVQAQEAVLQRIVRIYMDRSKHSDKGRAATRWMMQQPAENLSHFLLKALQSEKDLFANFDEDVQKQEAEYAASPNIKIQRLALNYAQIKVLFDRLAKLVGLSADQVDSTHDMIDRLIVDRQNDLDDDHPLVQEFWELIQYIEGKRIDDLSIDGSSGSLLDHSGKPGIIAINFNQIAELMDKYRQRLPADMVEIKKLLVDSKRFKFLQKNVCMKSAITNKSIRCWKFKGELAWADDSAQQNTGNNHG